MATKKSQQNDLFQILKQDHQEVSDLIEHLLEVDEDEREGLFFRLNEELSTHMSLEEKHFYDALEDAEETADLIIDARDEHDDIKQLLRDLEEEDIESEEWLSKLEELQEAKEHHVSEEEGELFTQARRVLSPDQLAEIAGKMMAEKGGAPAPAGRPAKGRRPRAQA
jgi:hypothetical protein